MSKGFYTKVTSQLFVELFTLGSIDMSDLKDREKGYLKCVTISKINKIIDDINKYSEKSRVEALERKDEMYKYIKYDESVGYYFDEDLFE
jgi:hypothetical protein